MRLVRRIPESKPDDPWKKEVTCWKCRIVWEIEESDLHVINTAVGYAGETWEPEIVCVCTECHENLVVSSLPSEMRFKLVNAEFTKRLERSQKGI